MIYKNNVKWILRSIGNHTIAHSVVIGDGNVLVDNGEGNHEDMKEIMAKHIKKVTCEHASISKELATLKNIIQISSTSLHLMSKKSDKKLESVLELLEMTLQSDYDFAIKIDRALVGIQKWSEDSKRTLHDMYKATSHQAPKEALSTIQFVASKCVGVHSRETLKKLLDIDRHAMEDDPTDQNMCFRGLIFWRQKDPENHNAKQLQKLLKDLDKITLEDREQVSESVLKLNNADLNMMNGVGEPIFIRMYRNVEETLAHVTSISQKLATIEQREILDMIRLETNHTPRCADVSDRCQSAHQT
ncbi:uncharacterized protein LOC110450656 [Mizuhopecten yessoensis]|uniref:uncharacterized protein LOC110450656 n=1 Tax=Mizuhopecten yessoensis TaxID=6573 RepID=UPI000B45E61D|nr:uncharacterized protein LOC110450656 [Mizuhopecten yessoensis]